MNQYNDDWDCLTTEEFAKKFKLTARTVRELIQQHKIKAFRIGGQWRISMEEVKRLIEAV